MKRTIPGSLSLLLLCLITSSSFLLSCSKSNTGEPQAPTGPKQLTVSSTEAAPYQFIKIQLPAGSRPVSLTATSIQVTVGAGVVEAYPDPTLFATNVYAYSLMVPEMAAGSQKISMPIEGGNTAEGSLKITAFTKITDVPAYIQSQQDDAEQEIAEASSYYDAQVQAGDLRAATADSAKAFLQQSFDKNKALVDALTDDEKRIYVQLVEANKSWLADFKQVFIDNPLSNYKVSAPGDCEELRKQAAYLSYNGYTDDARHYELQAEQCEPAREQKRIEATSVFSGKMKNAYEAAKDSWTDTKGVGKASWAFVSTFVTEASKGIFETATGLDDVKDPFALSTFFDTKQDRIMAQVFEVDKEYNYSAGLEVVNIGSPNAASIPGLNAIITGINTYNTAMTDLGPFLPYVPEMELPAGKTEKIYVSGYTIDQVSDARITIELKDGGRGKLIKVMLNTPVVAETIDFTFRVNYTTNYGSGSKVISGTLTQPVEKILVRATPFKVTNWVEGGVDMFTMHEIWRWQCNNIEYINKEQVLEATLSFREDGTGNSYEKYHEVYFENPSATTCDIRKVDQEKAYTGSMTWSYDPASKNITATFTDDEGQEKTAVAAVSIQNGTITFNGSGLLLSFVKK